MPKGVSLSKDASNLRTKRLHDLVLQLGPVHWNSVTAKAHYIHPHFPFILKGTPLTFAVILGCWDSIKALVTAGADAFEPVLAEVSAPLLRNPKASILVPLRGYIISSIRRVSISLGLLSILSQISFMVRYFGRLNDRC